MLDHCNHEEETKPIDIPREKEEVSISSCDQQEEITPLPLVLMNPGNVYESPQHCSSIGYHSQEGMAMEDDQTNNRTADSSIHFDPALEWLKEISSSLSNISSNDISPLSDDESLCCFDLVHDSDCMSPISFLCSSIDPSSVGNGSMLCDDTADCMEIVKDEDNELSTATTPMSSSSAAEQVTITFLPLNTTESMPSDALNTAAHMPSYHSNNMEVYHLRSRSDSRVSETQFSLMQLSPPHEQQGSSSCYMEASYANEDNRSVDSCDSIAMSNPPPGKIKGRKSLSDHATKILTNWILNHQDDPYPTQAEKELLARKANLKVKQVVDWMTNMRKRRLHPVVQGKRNPKSALDFMFLRNTKPRKFHHTDQQHQYDVL